MTIKEPLQRHKNNNICEKLAAPKSARPLLSHTNMTLSIQPFHYNDYCQPKLEKRQNSERITSSLSFSRVRRRVYDPPDSTTINWSRLLRDEERRQSIRDNLDHKQVSLFLDWVNKSFSQSLSRFHSQIVVHDLVEDLLKDGLCLIYLIECLYQVTLVKEVKKTHLHVVKNFETCVGFMKQNRGFAKCAVANAFDLAATEKNNVNNKNKQRSVLLGFLFLVKHDYEYNFKKIKQPVLFKPQALNCIKSFGSVVTRDTVSCQVLTPPLPLLPQNTSHVIDSNEQHLEERADSSNCQYEKLISSLSALRDSECDDEVSESLESEPISEDLLRTTIVVNSMHLPSSSPSDSQHSPRLKEMILNDHRRKAVVEESRQSTTEQVSSVEHSISDSSNDRYLSESEEVISHDKIHQDNRLSSSLLSSTPGVPSNWTSNSEGIVSEVVETKANLISVNELVRDSSQGPENVSRINEKELTSTIDKESVFKVQPFSFHVNSINSVAVKESVGINKSLSSSLKQQSLIKKETDQTAAIPTTKSEKKLIVSTFSLNVNHEAPRQSELPLKTKSQNTTANTTASHNLSSCFLIKEQKENQLPIKSSVQIHDHFDLREEKFRHQESVNQAKAPDNKCKSKNSNVVIIIPQTPLNSTTSSVIQPPKKKEAASQKYVEEEVTKIRRMNGQNGTLNVIKKKPTEDPKKPTSQMNLYEEKKTMAHIVSREILYNVVENCNNEFSTTAKDGTFSAPILTNGVLKSNNGKNDLKNRKPIISKPNGIENKVSCKRAGWQRSTVLWLTLLVLASALITLFLVYYNRAQFIPM